MTMAACTPQDAAQALLASMMAACSAAGPQSACVISLFGSSRSESLSMSMTAQRIHRRPDGRTRRACHAARHLLANHACSLQACRRPVPSSVLLQCRVRRGSSPRGCKGQKRRPRQSNSDRFMEEDAGTRPSGTLSPPPGLSPPLLRGASRPAPGRGHE